MNKKTGYERVDKNKVYYYVDYDNVVITECETNDETDDDSYNATNYYSDETVAKNNARADKLMRQLRRFAAENNECELDWSNQYQYKYYIFYDFLYKRLGVERLQFMRSYGQIYFSSEEIVKKAIEKYKNELLWYFTEYCDHVVEKPSKPEEPIRPKSRWEISSDGYYPYCKHCQEEPPSGEMTDFCPHCGADMRGE